ncbi:hypothetical protein AWZ03_004657 [Drosophila navojoa]|uniref:Uncharacterized protein n=1 Tax=Drosophila navojoa TaxID=7232 RepID=A0A484BJJ6_DRONA|nr:hypothetical protein AWZ03_004657 [Drosophila navojoa]
MWSPRLVVLMHPHYVYAAYTAKVLECSAKEDTNVTELFKTLLSLSRFLPASSGSSGGPGGSSCEAAPSGFKRRSSAYVSASSSRSE